MALSKRIRFEIFRRDDFKCRYCGLAGPEGAGLTVDHVVPLALGGSDDPSNLVAACKDCNAGKSSTSPDAPLVAQASEDAVRWAASLRSAMENELTAYGDREKYRRAFLRAWKIRDPKLSAIDQGWVGSVLNWQKAGYPSELLVEAVGIAWSHRAVARHGVFRYMAGIVWNQIGGVQARATEAVRSTAEPKPCGHCLFCLNPFEGGVCEVLNMDPCDVCDGPSCLFFAGREEGSVEGWRSGVDYMEAVDRGRRNREMVGIRASEKMLQGIASGVWANTQAVSGPILELKEMVERDESLRKLEATLAQNEPGIVETRSRRCA